MHGRWRAVGLVLGVVALAGVGTSVAEDVANPPGTDSVKESAEKTGEVLKDAAGDVKEKAKEAAEGAKKAVTDPAEAAKEAAEAAKAKTREVALSFRDDMRDFPLRVWSDVKALPSWRNGAVLAVGGGLAALSSERWDAGVRGSVRNDPERFGRAENNTLDVVANGYTLFGASAGVYGTSLLLDSERLHDFSLDMMSALTLALPTVEAFKFAFHTRRPNGQRNGFPSGHTAGAVTLATLLQQHFGLLPGIAGYTFAAFVAWHRIDAGKHDLSDVIFGAAIGYIAGQTAAETDEIPVVRAHLVPGYGGDAPAPGLRLEWRF